MKTKYNLSSLFAAVMLCIGLAGCGQSGGLSGEPDQTEWVEPIPEEENTVTQEQKLIGINGGISYQHYLAEKGLTELPQPNFTDGADLTNDTALTGGVSGKAPDWESPARLSVCGDSISTFTGYIPENYSKFYPENGSITRVEDTWWKQVIDRSGMVLCSNASYSGSTVTGYSPDNDEGRSGCGNKRVADLKGGDGSPPDVILVAMGANDLLNSVPLGVFDAAAGTPAEGEVDNFCDAYALMLDKIRRDYPEADVYCCNITAISRWNDETGEKFLFTNGLGLTARDYNEKIAEIAASRGRTVIDWFNCGINQDNAKEMTSDGTHPNPQGAKLMADAVCVALGIE